MTEDSEPVEGPEPTATEDAPPSWLKDEPEPSADKEENKKVSAEDLAEGSAIFVEGISYLHDFAAEKTGYGGFAMTERRVKLWNRAMKMMLKHVKVEKWPEIMALFMLGMDESMMLVGYLMWRKDQKSKEPPSMKDSPKKPLSVPPPPSEEPAPKQIGFIDHIETAPKSEGFIDHL